MLLKPNSLEVAVQKYVRPLILYISLIVLPIVAYGVQNSFTSLNWAFFLYVPVLVLCQLATHVESKEANVSHRGTKSVEDNNTLIRPSWTRIPTIFAAFYAFGSLILGVQEEATPNMVRIFGFHIMSSLLRICYDKFLT